VKAHILDESAGERPTMNGWQIECLSADQKTVAGWSWSQRDCTNTGILCGEIVGVDIDALDEELSTNLGISSPTDPRHAERRCEWRSCRRARHHSRRAGNLRARDIGGG
jgi:hypothetical protein